MAKKIAVIGLGTFGYELACQLTREGAEVLALDKDPNIIQEIKDSVTSAATLDALDKKPLIAMGIEDIDTVVIGFRNHFDTSILLTVLLKELGIEKIVALAASEDQTKALLKVGANQVVFPEKDTAQKLAHRLVIPALLDEIILSPQFGIIEISVPLRFVGKSLEDLDIRRNYLVHVIAVKHKSRGAKKDEKPITIIPPSDYLFSKEDRLLVMGENVHLKKFAKSN